MSDERPVTILNVEDYAASREAISDLLRLSGYDVIEAGTGSEALELAAAARPALVLLDVNLPDLSGLEVCRRLKADPATASTLVLQTSGDYLQSEDKVRGLDAGADGYLVKPVEPAVLLATIKSLLRLGRAEAAQRESERRLGLALKSAQLGTWDYDPATGALDWDDRCKELFGLPPDAEVNYATFLAGLHPDDRTRMHDVVQWMLNPASGGELDDEYRTVGLADGVERWVAANGRAYFDAAGRPLRFIGTVMDITARKRAEEELKEADRRKDEFLAMLAHELRNPLAPIRNAAALIGMTGGGAGDAENLRTAREMIERQVEHLTRLVDDLLDVSRITRGRVTLQPETVALSEVFARAVETSRPLVEARRHRLDVSLPPAPILVEGDPTRLAQVVENLLTNAAKYTDAGGEIRLSGEVEDGPGGPQAVVRVRDNGIGMAAELLPHVFDLFTQDERTLDRSQGGLGIGLTLVRRLVELHGGRVEALSEGPGRGSEFVVRLPVARKSEVESRKSEEGGSAAPNADFRIPNLRVLVVDDNADSAESLSLIFSLQGYEVRAAHDGQAALDAAAEFAPDVIVLDIGLPVMDGYEVARRLRERPEEGRLLLVALTGYGQERDRERALAAGFNHHLVKPVNFTELLSLVSRHQTTLGAAAE
jgi:PAS domain S-box-containing protein